jgi:tetratricopeptide (TPR) repeat protein
MTLAVLCTWSTTARSAPPVDWAAVHATTMRGIDLFYRLDTETAIQTFDSVSRMAPGDPRGPFFRSIVHFSLYLLDHNQHDHDAFLRASERTIAVCEQLLDQDDHDATAKFYLGGTYGYRGMLLQSEGSLLKAVSEGRQAYVLLEEAVEERPDFCDAHMGFGLFRYLVTKAPRSFHWVLKLVGITPDLEGGLQSLRLAAERGIYTRNEARLYLAQFLFNEHRKDEAFRYINELCREYPENALFLILRANFWQRDGRADSALNDAREALRRNGRHPLRYVQEIACNTLGGIYFARNEFPTARKYYMMYADSLRVPQRVSNWMWYRYGVACEISGDRTTAIAAYSRARKNSDDLRPNDAYYYRRAQELINRPMTPAETVMVKAGNVFAAKDYLAAHKLYDDALAMAGADPDAQSRALLGTLQVYFEEKQYDDVVRTAPKLFALTPQREVWVLPQGYFKLGQALARLNRKEEARRALKMVGEYDDYDFQEQLEQRVEEELNGLDN